MQKITFEQYCNQPAFPESVAVCDDDTQIHHARESNAGISRREYYTVKFAAAYLIGYADKSVHYDQVVNYAGQYADAALKDMFVRFQESQIE